MKPYSHANASRQSCRGGYYTDYGDSCPEQFYPLSPSNLQAMQHNPPAKNELDSLNTEGQQKHEFY